MEDEVEKKDFLKDVSVCICLREKLIGENLRRLRNTARAPQIHLLPNYLTLCISVLGPRIYAGGEQ